LWPGACPIVVSLGSDLAVMNSELHDKSPMSNNLTNQNSKILYFQTTEPITERIRILYEARSMHAANLRSGRHSIPPGPQVPTTAISQPAFAVSISRGGIDRLRARLHRTSVLTRMSSLHVPTTIQLSHSTHRPHFITFLSKGWTT
jgi:hypothetical protein